MSIHDVLLGISVLGAWKRKRLLGRMVKMEPFTALEYEKVGRVSHAPDFTRRAIRCAAIKSPGVM